jgi:spermidine synthase
MANKPRQHWTKKPTDPSQPPASGPAAPVLQGEKAVRLEGLALYLLVLLCGIAMMSLEMVGARVLWNDFGSSVFVWGSIISIFMAALALGYYGGGILADKKPSMIWLSAIVSVSGIMVLMLTQLAGPICRWVDGMNLGPRFAPLAAAMALYFLPSVLLGAVSPFAVKLQARTLSSLGNVAGRLYALSTLGSLIGTLLTTFALIPLMGVTNILYAIGMLLMVAAVLALAASFASRGGPRTGVGAAATIGLLAISLLTAWVTNPQPLPLSMTPTCSVRLIDDPVHYPTHKSVLVGNREYESAYHNIAVVDSFDPSKYQRAADDPNTIRWMRFNDLTESSIWLNRPGSPPQTTYTKILHMGMALHPRAKKVLVMGLGGGSVPREFCEVYSNLDMQVDVIEVDSQVVDVAAKYFLHRDDNGVRTFVADGRQFISRPQREHQRYYLGPDGKMHSSLEKGLPHYDLIILDAYSGGGQIPAHLVTREFLESARARLAPDGILVSNIIASLEGEKSRFFLSEYRTMRELFENIYVFPSFLGENQITRNLILVAPRRGRRLSKKQIVATAESLLNNYPVLATRTNSKKQRNSSGNSETFNLIDFARLCYTIGEVDIENQIVLTDDYAPVATMFYWTMAEKSR